VITRPLIQITCRRAGNITQGQRTRPGVTISEEDVSTLRLLEARNIVVSFVCDGQTVYEARVQAVLKRLIYLPDRKQWFIPSTLTGPLKPPVPRRPSE
jgi:hypothetical protein